MTSPRMKQGASMSSPRWKTGTCPECGATLPKEATSCWLCHLKLELGAAAAAPPQAPSGGAAGDAVGTSPFAGPPPPAAYQRRAAYQFSLASLMLVMTLVAVLLGVFRISPGIGVALAIVAAPALVRTCVIAARGKVRGQPTTQMGKVEVFVSSMGVLVIVGIAAAVTFFGTCIASFVGAAIVGQAAGAKGYGPVVWGGWVGLGLGIVAAVFVASRLLRRFWRRKGGAS